MDDHTNNFSDLPQGAVEFIDGVVKNVRYRKKVRLEVRDELIDHFCMALSECNTAEEKEAVVKGLIAGFGDVKTLGSLIRRGKKRCRPLWKKAVVRTFQGVGVFVLCFITYVVWFFSGTPNPTVDYLEVFNEYAKPEIVDGDNAWPYYEKAVSLYIKPDKKTEELSSQFFRNPELSFDSLSSEERVLIESWVAANDAAWNEYSTGAEMPYCFREYDCGKSEEEGKLLISILMPHLAELKHLSQVGVWRAKLAMKQGDSQQAIDYCVTLLKVSKQWLKRGTLIETLVGMSIGGYGCQQAFQVLAEGNLSIDELGEAAGEWSSVFAGDYPYLDYEGERLLIRDVIQHWFTDSGPGGGHLALRLVDIEMASYLIDAGRFFPAGLLFHAGRDKTIEKTDEIYEKISEIARNTPYENYSREVSIDGMLAELPQNRYFTIHLLTPALDKITQIRYMSEASYEAVLAVFAIKRWELEKGVLPAGLDVLVDGGLLGELPDDPYSDGPLVYRVDGGGFVLYSVSENFSDDGGVYGTNRKSKDVLWGENGDAVFWPLKN